jgi:hypothetical protein
MDPERAAFSINQHLEVAASLPAFQARRDLSAVSHRLAHRL